MKKNEIKRTIEEVVRVEYIAEDGTTFRSEEECQKYEESALFAVSKNLKRLNSKWASIYDLTENGCEEEELEIFDIQTEDDLENLRKYLYLKLSKNRASETMIKDCFGYDSKSREDYALKNITAGHEVLIFWSYDNDWCWTHRDGSLDGYISWLKDKYAKIIAPKEEDNQ